jgi:hypothetical protein
VKQPYVRGDVAVERLGPPCDAGDGDACTDLGLALVSARDSMPEIALPACVDRVLFDRACEHGSWRGCRELALLATQGDCRATDLATARDVLDTACRRLEFAACDAKARIAIPRR